MTFLFERRLCLGGLEILVRCDRPCVLELAGSWDGYQSSGRTPDLVHEFRAVAGFAQEQPADRPYPGFGCKADDSGRYEFARKDASGELTIDTDPNTALVTRFTGAPTRGALESTLRLALSACLLKRGGFLVHGTGVASDERAIVLAGPSGAGKSTLHRLLAGVVKNDKLLGDEIIIIRPEPLGNLNGTLQYRAYATPFGGECPGVRDASGPLTALYFLVKAARHRAALLTPREGMPLLLRNVLAYVQEARAAALSLTGATALVGRVPCYRLEFLPDHGITKVLGVS